MEMLRFKKLKSRFQLSLSHLLLYFKFRSYCDFETSLRIEDKLMQFEENLYAKVVYKNKNESFNFAIITRSHYLQL